VADRNSPQKHVWCTQIVLLSAEGVSTSEINRPVRLGRGDESRAEDTRRPALQRSPVCSKPGSQSKAQAPVRHGAIPLRRSAVDPNIPKTPLVHLRQQLPVATAPIPGNDEFQQPAKPKTENGAKTAGARRARSFRAPMRCRTSLAFSAGQTTRRPNRRARPLWRCPARVQVFHPQDDVLRTLGYIPIHARSFPSLASSSGIEITHQPWGPPCQTIVREGPGNIPSLVGIL
jgi:hypothetical protein